MTFAKDIIFSGPDTLAEAEVYEARLKDLPLNERLKDCQALSEETIEASISKVFLLSLLSDSQIVREVRRILAWKHGAAKARFFIAQLGSQNEKIVIEAINLLGVLKQPFCIPHLGLAFDLQQVEICRAIIEAISEMNDPLGAKIIKQALESPDNELVLLSIQKLSAWIEFVPWKIFKPLIRHKDGTVRTEAAFAIALRKNPRSARTLFDAIAREKDRGARLSMIRFVGMIPHNKSLMQLLQITVHDNDQKARLMASRTTDRLQGLLKPQQLFHLRHTLDINIRSEVLFRLGKFGSEVEKHKAYLRKTVKESKDPRIVQACLTALGFVAEHKDLDLITKHLSKDPMTSYIAALALTKIWRLNDVDLVLATLAGSISSVQRQVFLKFLIRRRGFFADPKALFETVRKILEEDENVNVRYLAFCLLEFAPSADTVLYLLSSYEKSGNPNDRSAIDIAMKSIAAGHGEYVLSMLKDCDSGKCRLIMKHVPDNADSRFYRSLSNILFSRYDAGSESGAVQELCREILTALAKIPAALKQAAQVLPDTGWKKLFLNTLIEGADREQISAIREELVLMLKDEDPEVAGMAMTFIISLKDPSVIPDIVSVAESDARADIRALAQNITKTFVREGVI